VLRALLWTRLVGRRLSVLRTDLLCTNSTGGETSRLLLRIGLYLLQYGLLLVLKSTLGRFIERLFSLRRLASTLDLRGLDLIISTASL
jgi:hypothetical protein